MLGNGNGFELYLEPVFDALLRFVVLAVGEAGELDGARHVDGIDRGGGQLVQARVVPLHKRGGDERHPARDHVHGNDVKAFALVRRKLAKIGAEKIRKRAGGVDAFVPSSEGRALRTFDDRGANDGNGKVAALLREDGFAKTFRERIRIGPAQMLCALHAGADKAIADPTGAIAFGNRVKFTWSDFRRIACTAKGLAAKGFRQFRTFRPLLDALNHFTERSDFLFGIEIGMAAGIVVGAEFFVDAAVAHADHVAGGEMHQSGVVALAQEIEEVASGIDVGGERVA